MRKFNEQALELCKIQGQIFAESTNKIKGSSLLFIRRYMNSTFCNKLDNMTYLFEKDNVFDEINNCGNKGIKISKDILYWVGYIYRYWAYTYNLSSKNIYKIIPGSEIVSLYGPYHTLDPENAIQRIYEHKRIKPQQSQLDLIRDNYKNILK